MRWASCAAGGARVCALGVVKVRYAYEGPGKWADQGSRKRKKDNEDVSKRL